MNLRFFTLLDSVKIMSVFALLLSGVAFLCGLYLVFIPPFSLQAQWYISAKDSVALEHALALDPYNRDLWLAELYHLKRTGENPEALHRALSLVKHMHDMSDADYMRLQHHLNSSDLEIVQ